MVTYTVDGHIVPMARLLTGRPARSKIHFWHLFLAREIAVPQETMSLQSEIVNIEILTMAQQGGA